MKKGLQASASKRVELRRAVPYLSEVSLAIEDDPAEGHRYPRCSNSGNQHGNSRKNKALEGGKEDLNQKAVGASRRSSIRSAH